jgi:hypothetical protein
MVVYIQIEKKVSVKVETDGTAIGVAYWFTLHMYGGLTISTYQPEAVSQSDPRMHLCTPLSSFKNNNLLTAGFKPLASECVFAP